MNTLYVSMKILVALSEFYHQPSVFQSKIERPITLNVKFRTYWLAGCSYWSTYSDYTYKYTKQMKIFVEKETRWPLGQYNNSFCPRWNAEIAITLYGIQMRV